MTTGGVVYLNESDLKNGSKEKSISEVELSDFTINMKFLEEASMVIFTEKEESRIVKSRFTLTGMIR